MPADYEPVAVDTVFAIRNDQGVIVHDDGRVTLHDKNEGPLSNHSEMEAYDYDVSAEALSDRRRAVRKRNFTTEEEQLLNKIIEPFISVVENKSNSCSARNAKNTAWAKIANLYNALTHKVARTEPELRKRWDNNKTKARNQMKRQFHHPSDGGGGGGGSSFNGSVTAEYQDHEVVSDNAGDYDDDCDTNESPSNAANSLAVVAVEGNSVFENTPSCSSDQQDDYHWTKRKQQSTLTDSSLKAKAEYFKYKKQFHIRSLELAEEQNERAKVLFELDVRKRHLELEFLEVQISAQKKLLSST